MDKLTWTELSRKTLLKCPIFSVSETNCLSPQGDSHLFTILEAMDWAIIVPVVGQGDFLMVRQWRHGSGSISLEFPGGVFERNEDPIIAAKRELREETGYTTENIIKLGEFNPNPAFMSNKVHIFLARDLENMGHQELDDDEYVDIQLISQKEVLNGMGRPPFTHALMASALLLYQLNTKDTCKNIEN